MLGLAKTSVFPFLLVAATLLTACADQERVVPAGGVSSGVSSGVRKITLGASGARDELVAPALQLPSVAALPIGDWDDTNLFRAASFVVAGKQIDCVFAKNANGSFNASAPLVYAGDNTYVTATATKMRSIVQYTFGEQQIHVCKRPWGGSDKTWHSETEVRAHAALHQYLIAEYDGVGQNCFGLSGGGLLCHGIAQQLGSSILTVMSSAAPNATPEHYACRGAPIGSKRLYNPAAPKNISGLSPSTRLYVVISEGDAKVCMSAQRTYVERVREAGRTVETLTVSGTGRSSHKTAKRAAKWWQSVLPS